MKKERKVDNLSDGWKFLTDLLRSMINCKKAQQVIDVVETLIASDKAHILRLKPRFGPKCKNLNDLMINFNYKGQMICEL